MLLTTTECERLWRNVRIATLDPAVAKPYGMLENHILGIRAGLVSLILPEGELDLSGFDGEVIDAKGCLLTPGLIDSHTHLVYGGNRAGEFEQRLSGASYGDIARAGGGIMSTVRATRALSEEELVALACPRLEALLAEGCTTIEIKSGYGLTAKDELKMLRAAKRLGQELPVRIRTTLLAAHALPPEYKDNPDGYLDMICNELLPRVAEEGLADAVDIFCESIAFTLPQAERLFQAARSSGLGIKVHAEQLTAGGAAALAARYGAWSADHLEYLDEAGAFAMQASGTVALLLPGAFYFLQETRKPPIGLLRRLGVAMALATDLNPGSSPLASLRLMMNMGCTLFGLTPEEALAAVTRNAALALGLGSRLGTLAIGQEADMLLWDMDHPAQLAGEVGWGGPSKRFFKGELCHVPESVTPPYLRWPERPQPWAFPRVATVRRRFTGSNERNATGGVVAPALSGAPVFRRHGFRMYTPPNMILWQGRIDQEPEGDLRRWHQAVVPLPSDGGEPGIALLGICCDSGVSRNHGRPGARNGPDAIRTALGGQAWHLALKCYDAGNLVCIDDDLEALQEEQAFWVEKLLELGHFPLILGGGHEIAFGSYLGLSRRLDSQRDAAVIGVINFDAHLDMRKSPQPNSGTSFLQIADLCRVEQRQFRYFCLGLSQVSNTRALFDRAGALGVEWLTDESLTSWNLANAEERLTDFLAGCDSIYLSIDLDVLPLAVAPGVSAPAARGVPLEVVEHLLTWIRNKAGKRLALADIAECNPAYDIDGRTAKVAARLCHQLAR